MNLKQRISYTMLLLASLFVLLSVVLPHQHHTDGSPCYEWFWHGDAEEHPHDHSSHAMDCSGHSQALLSSLDKHVLDGDHSLEQVPWCILFFSSIPEIIDELYLLSEKVQVIYYNLLYTSWIPLGSGLRAPPYLI